MPDRFEGWVEPMHKRFALGGLLATVIALAGCLNLDQVRVTPEHRQLKNKTGIVVLMDASPRLHHLQLSALDSTATTLQLPNWDGRRIVTDYLAERMRGMALDVRTVTYNPDDFPPPYDSSMAYPAYDRMRPVLGDWAAAHGLDMVVVIYRQVEQDYIGESVENLIGYGLVRHGSERTDAYAALYLEAIDTSGGLVGNSDGLKHLPVDASLWSADFEVDKSPVTVDGERGEALGAAISQVLRDAVLTAAQEAGLSH